jgi:hypothetical protein
MIRKLQNRFVRIAVLVLTAAMVTVVGIINTANLIIVRSELAGTVRELTVQPQNIDRLVAAMYREMDL